MRIVASCSVFALLVMSSACRTQTTSPKTALKVGAANPARPCAQPYPKADTLVMERGDQGARMAGAMSLGLGANGTLSQPTPGGPDVVWIIRAFQPNEAEFYKSKGYDFRTGRVYEWRQTSEAFSWDDLKDMKYLCDFDASLSDDQLWGAFSTAPQPNR